MRLRRPLILALLCVLAAAPAAAEQRIVSISPNDYPEDVRPGTSPLRVRVRYELAADGRFARCDVSRSSGHPSIDAASCGLLRERAQFRPEPGLRRGTLQLEWQGEAALPHANPRGAPIPISLVDEVSSNDYPPDALRRREGGTISYVVAVSETGVPRRCMIAEPGRSEALERRTCDIVMARSAFIAASDGAGGRRSGLYRGRIRWVPGGD